MSVLAYKKVVKTLKENGWKLLRTKGSHEIYGNGLGIIVPVKCTEKDIPSGTVASISRITGIDL